MVFSSRAIGFYSPRQWVLTELHRLRAALSREAHASSPNDAYTINSLPEHHSRLEIREKDFRFLFAKPCADFFGTRRNDATTNLRNHHLRRIFKRLRVFRTVKIAVNCKVDLD